MRKSSVLVIDGVFLGAVLSLPEAGGWRIIAADPRLTCLHGVICTSPREAESLARRALLTAPRADIAA